MKPVKRTNRKKKENSSKPPVQPEVKTEVQPKAESVAEKIWSYAKSQTPISAVALEELWEAVALAKKELGR